jgi:hypothetical protein
VSVDSEGIWHPDISIYPGTAGGANAGLDLLNAFRGQQNYQQSHEAKLLALRRMLLSDPNGGALMQSPGADVATGMTPDEMQQMDQQTPSGQFQSYARDNPDATPEQLYGQQARLGMVTPSSLGSVVRGGITDQGKMERMRLSVEAKYGKDQADNFVKMVGLGFAPQQALDLVMTQPTGTVAPGIGPAPKVQSADDLSKAREGKLNAEAVEIPANAKSKRALEGAHATELGARATEETAKANLTDLTAEVKRQAALGAVNPETQAKFDESWGRAAESISRTRTALKKMKPGSPEYLDQQALLVSMGQAFQDASATRAKLKPFVLNKPGAASAASATTNAGPARFKSQLDFVNAYVKKWGVPPADTVLAKAKELGDF